MDSLKDKDKNQMNEKDDRVMCKYGRKCYQKNPSHHNKFKHPPKNENENKEVIGKKRKTPDNSESSSSNTPKVKKLYTPGKDEGSSGKTEDSKMDENAINNETISAEITKNDSKKVIKGDSTTEKVDGMGTNTNQKADNSETEISSEQEKTNKTNVNNFSKTKNNEDIEEKGAKGNITVEKGTEEKDTEKKDTEEKDAKEKDAKEKDTEEKDAKEKDTKKNVKSTADATDKKTETKTAKVEKATDDKSKAHGTVEKDSKRPSSKEKLPANPKRNTEERKSNIKTEILKNDSDVEARKLIEKAFLVPMPSDFYKFYEFCKDVKSSDPSTALRIAELKLVGPYDVLNGLITKEIVENTNLLTHWRYYYDPPEFQTVIKGNDKEGLHFGYWRDRPSTDPIFVASNCSNVSHKIKPVAENIFGAVAYYLEEKSKKANPFERSGLSSLLGKLKNFAKNHNISLEIQSDKMKSREKNVVARTIHGAGIACPYNKKSQLGYRELSVTDNQLLKIVKKLEDAQSDEERLAARAELGEVVRLATIAGDECDFGTCLELGHDLLSTGCFHVQNAALAVLSIAYNQLDRQAFLQIVEAHLKNRKKSCNTSALEVVSKE